MSSLKVIESEELIDLVLFRPLGFLFVKLIYPTFFTPNHVTLLSMIFGVLAGVSIGFGNENQVFIGGIFVLLSTVLDCADGQLARLKQNGTVLGRLLDGIVDYISTFSIFIGIGFYGAHLSYNPLYWWVIIIITGLTYAVQAGLVDFYRSEYISNVNDRPNFLAHELVTYKNELEKVRYDNSKVLTKTLLKMYIFYTNLQCGPGKDRKICLTSDMYIKKNKWSVTLWNLNGTSMHAFVLIICALMYKLEWYIWYILIFGNLFTLAIWIYQKFIDSKHYQDYNTDTAA